MLRKIERPVTCASCGLRRAITAWPLTLRSDGGLRLTNMKPPPARLPPVKPTTVATASSRRMMSTTWRSLSPIACDEMLWSARRPPFS